ncbi:MAG: N-acetyl-gamma-glutamyl-phosphate reductase [Paramuribaculum sp.]|nr:N-acetyl-gamma-glutamyl-phosphate reductase [Paramuribaculum sp.]
MIRAGIAGGTTTVAGEITKLLINHPDIEIQWIYDPEAEGALVSRVHKGLQGETYMRFSADAPMDNINVVFLCFDEPGLSEDFVTKAGVSDNVKIIDVSGDFLEKSTFADGDEWVFGLPELSRKPLVRGAKHTSLPRPLTTAVLLGLLPLAKNLLLNTEIYVTAVVNEPDAEPGEALCLLEHEESDEIARALTSVQQSFAAPMLFLVIAGGWERGITVNIYLDCPISEKEAVKLYQDYYDDHSFTFLSDATPSITEVLGTNKTIINLQKVSKKLVVSVAIDDLMKGSAAMAVHDMNLLFGLQERVGLMLKSH